MPIIQEPECGTTSVEFGDTSISDSDTCSSSNGLIDWSDFTSFNMTDFPNLQAGLGEDVKIEPVSPLPSSPCSGQHSPLSDFISSSQVLDTPPISPPQEVASHVSGQMLSNAEIIKIITLNPNSESSQRWHSKFLTHR